MIIGCGEKMWSGAEHLLARHYTDIDNNETTITL